MLSIPQRINAFNEYRYKLTTNKAMGDYASGVGINDIIKNIGDGAYNVELENKTVVSLDKAQNQALAKTMVTDDFNKRLMTDPKALKADVDAGKFPWKVKGIGELYNADDKASMLAKLDKAVEQQQIKLDDIIKQESNAIFLAAYNNDPVAIERARALAESPNATKTQKEYWDYIKNKQPVDCETNDESLLAITNAFNDLASVDIDREVGDGKPSGKVEYQQKSIQLQMLLQDHNQKFKDLGGDYLEGFNKVVNQFNNLNFKNRELYVKNLNTIPHVKGVKDFWVYQRETLGNMKGGKGSQQENERKEALYEAQTKRYINAYNDIVINREGLTQEQVENKLKMAGEEYINTMQKIYLPFLFDKTTKEKVKKNSEVMIGDTPFVFVGYEDNGFTPIIKMKR